MDVENKLWGCRVSTSNPPKAPTIFKGLEKEFMEEQDFNKEFNRMLGKVMTLLEVSQNNALKREVKSALYDFSDNVRERVCQGERDNGDTIQ